MNAFKDLILQDLSSVFFNPDEFSGTHKINGRDMTVILDDDRLSQRIQKDFDGMVIGEILYFVKKSEYGEKPSIGEPQRFDKRQMYITDVKEPDGMYEIILSQNRMG